LKTINEILFSIYHNPNGGPDGFIFILTKLFNLLFYAYVKSRLNYKLDFRYFLGILHHVFAHPSQTLAKQNDQPHKSQLGDKMIKGKGDNMGRVENIGVISQGRKKNMKEKCLKNNTKMNECKKRLNNGIITTHAHK
jgi:hypothetical protein